MAIRKLLIPFMFLFVFSLGATAASAQGANWIKLGEKDVNFNLDHDRIIARNKGAIREIRMRVRYAPVHFTRIVINYKDGDKKEMEFMEAVEVGRDSRNITIEGDGHKISSLDLYYETASLGGKKAKVTAYGRP
jgi:hypothetical protein